MPVHMQLRTDGTEVEWRQAARTWRMPPIGPAMQCAMWLLGIHGRVTSTFVGMKWHKIRGRCGVGARQVGERSKACCAYAGTDGNEIMKRLARRGAVKREDGAWVRT